MRFNKKPGSAFPQSSKNHPQPLDAGVYPFTIADAQESVSKQGNEMMVIDLELPKNTIVKDYITSKATWKLKQLCECVGAADLFESGEITAEQLVGYQGHVAIEIQVDESGKYWPKNSVKKYLAEGERPTKKEPMKAATFDDDDLAF